MTTPATTSESVFTLLKRQDLRASRAQWVLLTLLTLIAWFGGTAFVGQYRPNQVAALIEAALPGSRAFPLLLITSIAVSAAGFILRRTTFAAAAAMIAAFLGGHWLYEQLYAVVGLRISFPLTSLVDGVHFAAARLLWALCILALAVPVWSLTFARHAGVPDRLTLGWGDWSVRARDFSATRPPESYTRILFTGYLGFVVVLLVLAQAGVAFRPLRSGTLLSLLPAVLLSAAANATAEEIVFRGLIQPAFIRFGGLAAGLWMQGALFGLMHWGTSVGVLAALPVSLGIGLGSVVWGKAALETRGIGWVIVAHMMIDVAVMAAYFV